MFRELGGQMNAGGEAGGVVGLRDLFPLGFSCARTATATSHPSQAYLGCQAAYES